ncbi:uncharacterized protein [Atheta coriaria]
MNFEFTKPEYNFQVIDDKIVSEDTIELVEGLDHDIDVTIEDSEFSKYFSVELDYLTGSIKLILKESLPEAPKHAYSNTDFSLTLKATWQKREIKTILKITSDKELEIVCYVPVLDINKKSFDNLERMDDVFEGTFFNISNIKNVASMDCQSNKYITCNFANGEFKMSTTEEYKNYEDNEFEDIIKMNITIKCPYDTKTLEFRQRIRDTNNHVPEFPKDADYTFSFYNRIPENFEITLMRDITVTEKDLTTTDCNFKLPDQELFSVRRADVEGKVCKAKIISLKAIDAEFDETFRLTVDDGDDESMSEVDIHIKVTKDESDQPLFTEAEYFLKAFEDNGKTLQTYEGYEAPNLKNGMDSEITFEIFDENLKDKFAITANKLTGKPEVTMKVTGLDLCDNCPTFTFPIKAKWRQLEAETKVTIVFSKDFQPPTTTPATTTAETPTSTPVGGPGGDLHGFSAFMLSSLLGVIMMFVVSFVGLAAMLYIIRKRFFVESKPNAAPLPEKLPI